MRDNNPNSAIESDKATVRNGSFATICHFQKPSFTTGVIVTEWVVVLRLESLADNQSEQVAGLGWNMQLYPLCRGYGGRRDCLGTLLRAELFLAQLDQIAGLPGQQALQMEGGQFIAGV